MGEQIGLQRLELLLDCLGTDLPRLDERLSQFIDHLLDVMQLFWRRIVDLKEASDKVSGLLENVKSFTYTATVTMRRDTRGMS